VSDTDLTAPPASGIGPAGPAGCPVDHAALQRAREAGCPVDHEALAGETKRPSSTCAYAGGGKRGYLVPGIIAFLCLLGLGTVLNITDFSHSSGSSLGGPLVASQIASAYQTGTGGGLPTVRCPAAEPVAAGHRFTCTLQQGSAPARAVTVTETGGGRFGFHVAGPAGP
jgi:hypothetical protein